MTRDEIGQQIVRFRDWLNQNQVATEGSRLDDIITAAQQVLAAEDARAYLAGLSREERGRLVESYFDAYSFVLIFLQMSTLDPRVLPRQLLKDAILGPADPADEVPGNETVNARNYMFELELASKFMASGHRVISFDDIVVDISGVRINIQCKRIQGIQNLRGTFARAVQQVQARIPDTAQYGVVAISLDRVVGTTTRACFVPQPPDLTTVTRRMIEPYHNDLLECLRTTLAPRILGGMLDLKCFGIAADNAQPVLSRQSACAPLDASLGALRPESELFKLLIKE
jgi:hypothetical protein